MFTFAIQVSVQLAVLMFCFFFILSVLIILFVNSLCTVKLFMACKGFFRKQKNLKKINVNKKNKIKMVSLFK